MKSIKFWAEHKEDTTNFFNALKAHGNTDNLEWVRDPRIFSGDGSETGWFVDNTGGVTYTRDEDYFGLHEAREFFFPIPGTLLSDEKPVISDGGSSSYYQLTITNKAGESIQCETGDILRVLVGNDYDLSNIVKACRRSYEASQGRGKAGASIEYDMNKVIYFATEFKHWNKQ